MHEMVQTKVRYLGPECQQEPMFWTVRGTSPWVTKKRECVIENWFSVFLKEDNGVFHMYIST